MTSRDKPRPSPPPRVPALVRPAVGVLLLALGGVADAGCAKRHPPPMPPPPMPPPMIEPPMAPPTDETPEGEPPADEPPMPEEAPMVAPMPNPG